MEETKTKQLLNNAKFELVFGWRSLTKFFDLHIFRIFISQKWSAFFFFFFFFLIIKKKKGNLK